LVASAIAMAIGWQLLTLTHVLGVGTQRLQRSSTARVAAQRLEERLNSDAMAAWSLFVPPVDRFGRSNADRHELDFVTEDDGHRTLWWAYAFDSGARCVTRYGFDPSGSTRAGESYDGIERFSAATYPITDVVRRHSAVYDPLFANATVKPVDVSFGWMSGVAGGNRLADVRYRAADKNREVVLASGGAPTRVTIVFSYTPPPRGRP
jgi:hypothetical protein